MHVIVITQMVRNMCEYPTKKKKEERKQKKKIEYTDRSIQKILNQWDVFKIDVKLTVK